MIKKLLVILILFCTVSIAQTGWIDNYDLSESSGMVRFTVSGALDTIGQTNDTLWTPALSFFTEFSNYYWTLWYNFDAAAIKADIFMERKGEFASNWTQYTGDTLVTATTDGGDNWVTYNPGVDNVWYEQYRLGIANVVAGRDSTYFKMQFLGVKK